MRLGKQDIALLRFAVPGRPYPRDSRSDDLWFQHLAIVVNDIDAAHAHLHLRSIVLKLPDPIGALATTEAFWRDWSSRFHGAGEWSEPVLRSLITLKALTYRPTGGIAAAPTTSLPEQLGGTRNWDYRFCWLRDATFTLLALMNGGYYEEARRGERGYFAPPRATRRRFRSSTDLPGNIV